MIRIRNGRLHEIGLLQQIERQAATRFQTLGMPRLEITEARLLAERAQQGQLLIAEGDDRVAGFVIFSVLDGSAHIEELDVLPAFAGRRLGALLIDHVEIWAKHMRLPALIFSTFRDVPWNAPYYARLGFAVVNDDQIEPGMAAVSQEHSAKGLNVAPRVWMRREILG